MHHGGKKTQSQRVRKQLVVRYGVDQTDKIALTTNLSETGINLNPSNVFEPGVSVQPARQVMSTSRILATIE